MFLQPEVKFRSNILLKAVFYFLIESNSLKQLCMFAEQTGCKSC